MIGYALLTAGVAGSGACAYFLAPAARGAHRLVMPRSHLLSRCTRLDAETECLRDKLLGLASELEAVTGERDVALAFLGQAEQLVSQLDAQLAAFGATCAENIQLRQDLANAYSIRPLSAGGAASALPDEHQEFADETGTAWRANA